MELVKPQIRFPLARACAWLAILTMAACCGACGPQVIKGRPPFLRISELSTAGPGLSADFDISNQNGVDMNIDALDIRVTVGAVEIRYNDPSIHLAIGANSTEQLHAGRLPEDGVRPLLTSLENGEVISLPFDLTGQVHTQEDGLLEFDQTGHLYPVPGKRGFFRSAVTQSKELRRDEPF